MKKISIVVPCYNEEENVEPLSNAIIETINSSLPEYSYELIFIDNDSADSTRSILRQLAEKNKNIKLIFNAKNFGQFNSPYYGLLQSTGDCTMLICADFQDPIEMIPTFVHEWENGNKLVIGQKTSSQENKFMYFLRSLYYKTIKHFSQIEQIEHFTGFGLYDKEFVNILRNLNDPTPFLRGIVAELGYKVKIIPYEQRKRKAGRTSNNFYTLYDAAMLSFTSYTKVGLRIATFLGFAVAGVSFVIAMVYLVMKLIHWNEFNAGTAPTLLSILFMGAVILIFLGLLGEYVLSINARVMNRPLVIEEERINFEEEDDEV